jgi:hypothetical protein
MPLWRPERTTLKGAAPWLAAAQAASIAPAATSAP